MNFLNLFLSIEIKKIQSQTRYSNKMVNKLLNSCSSNWNIYWKFSNWSNSNEKKIIKV